jgi:hypothetical protein
MNRPLSSDLLPLDLDARNATANISNAHARTIPQPSRAGSRATIPYRKRRVIVAIPVSRRSALDDPALPVGVARGARGRIVHDPLDVDDAAFFEGRAELAVLRVQAAADEERPRHAEDDGARHSRSRDGGRQRPLSEIGADPDADRGDEQPDGCDRPRRKADRGRVVDDLVGG